MRKAIRNHILALVGMIIFSIALGIGLWKFAILMFNKQKRVIEVKERLALYKGNKEIFEKETDQLKLLTERATNLEKYLITSSTLPALLSSIEEMAKKDKVSFSITSAQSSGNVGAEKLFISFHASGDLQAIDGFLEELSHQTYQISFKNFSLMSKTQEIDESKVINSKTVVTKKVGNPSWEVSASVEVLSFAI